MNGPLIIHFLGVFCIAAAFVLLCIVSISLPYLTAVDFVRVSVKSAGSIIVSNVRTLSELRLGTWANCYYETNGNRVCTSAHIAYTTVLGDAQGNTVTIGGSWTRGLIIHVFAAGAAFIALLFSACLRHIITSLLVALATLLTFIVFLVDIALVAYFKAKIGDLSDAGTTSTAPAFWMTFGALIFLIIGTVIRFRHKQERGHDSKIYTRY